MHRISSRPTEPLAGVAFSPPAPIPPESSGGHSLRRILSKRILERQQPPDLNFEKVSKNVALELGRIAKTVRIPFAVSKFKYIPCSGMPSGNELPDVVLLFPCSIFTFVPQSLQQNVQLGEQKCEVGQAQEIANSL